MGLWVGLCDDGGRGGGGGAGGAALVEGPSELEAAHTPRPDNRRLTNERRSKFGNNVCILIHCARNLAGSFKTCKR